MYFHLVITELNKDSTFIHCLGMYHISSNHSQNSSSAMRNALNENIHQYIERSVACSNGNNNQLDDASRTNGLMHSLYLVLQEYGKYMVNKTQLFHRIILLYSVPLL